MVPVYHYIYCLYILRKLSLFLNAFQKLKYICIISSFPFLTPIPPMSSPLPTDKCNSHLSAKKFPLQQRQASVLNFHDIML